MLRCNRRLAHRGKHRSADAGGCLIIEWGRMTKKELIALKKAGGAGTQILRITLKGAS